MNDYNIVQINLNHCWGAHDMLQNYIKEKEIDIAIIAEPVNIPDGNWVGSNNKGSAIFWSNKIRERIKVVVNGNDFVAIERENSNILLLYVT